MAGTALLLATFVLVVYTRKLGDVPPYLHHDELFFAVQAQSIAATGHDTHGRLLPLYVEVAPGTWFLPAVVYFTALILKILPASDAAVRLPTVLVGVFNVLAVYFIGKKLFQREAWALVAAILMALTPAHLIHARLAMDYLYPVPFVLGWLWLLISFLERNRPWLLFSATMCLGFGSFTYIAAVGMMPVYLAITCLVIWARNIRPWKSMAIAVAGLAWPILLAVPFVLHYPEVFMSKWHTYGAANAGTRASLDPLQQARELLSYNSVSARTTLFFSFFNPGYLFMSGGANILNSTRRAGVFLMPLALFVPVGIYQVFRHRRTAANVVIVAGFFTAPLAALTVFEGGAIDRELEVLPFGALLATFGVELLWSAALTTPVRRFYRPLVAVGIATAVGYAVWSLFLRGRLSASFVPLLIASCAVFVVGMMTDTARSWRPITASLLVLAVLEFQFFYRDYLGDYRLRALGHFEGNRRRAIKEIVARADRRATTRIFVSQQIQYGDAAWFFYTKVLGRSDLRATFFVPDSLTAADIPTGSLVWTTSTVTADRTFISRTGLSILEQITEPDGAVSFLVLEKTGPNDPLSTSSPAR